jgi:hypothetical protein
VAATEPRYCSHSPAATNPSEKPPPVSDVFSMSTPVWRIFVPPLLARGQIVIRDAFSSSSKFSASMTPGSRPECH